MSDEEKKDFSSAIDKIKNDQVDEMTDGEISVLKNHLAVKDQSGSPDPSKRRNNFFYFFVFTLLRGGPTHAGHLQSRDHVSRP